MRLILRTFCILRIFVGDLANVELSFGVLSSLSLPSEAPHVEALDFFRFYRLRERTKYFVRW